MIHIATVHHLSDKWIDIQLKYINKYIKTPYRVYAFLNGIKKDHSYKFHYSSKDNIIPHAEKLNLLASEICKKAKDSDFIIFLDGDAFPINEIDSLLKDKIPEHKLIAIKRSLDFGDGYPHPAFCVTTVGFWKKIKGDWNEGYKWYNPILKREFTDVGANLWKLLIDNDTPWFYLLRSNKINIHDQWFGVYGDLIYHHGAGFRSRLSRFDRHRIRSSFTFLQKIQSKIIFLRRFLYTKVAKENNNLSESIFFSIETDFSFYKKL